jgi:penicillin-binding protein 1A
MSQQNQKDLAKILKEREPLYERIIKISWKVFYGTLGFTFLLFLILSFFLPSFEQLENPKINVASEIYASDGALLGKFYIENRSPVPFDSISPHVINALVSTEDARFYSHSGIDAEALSRVLFKTVLLFSESSGGGSTISQQLAKLLVGRPNTRKMFFLFRYPVLIITKLKEWLTAIKLERSYTKKEILAIYLNEFDFLYNAHGIRSAAETYFGKHPHDLDIAESAMLVRMLKNPAVFNYKRDMKRALIGRQVVLKNMLNKKHITKEQYETISEEPIDASKFKMQDHNEGMGTYFREYLREHLKVVLDRPENRKANGEPYDLYRDGLKIYTTIDSRIQGHLEQGVWDHLSQHQQHMFKHWADWNMANPPIGTSKQSPWTYMDYKNKDSEIDLRLLSLGKLIWESDRYKAVRGEYLPTAIKNDLTDVDIFRIQIIEKVKKKPRKDKETGAEIDEEALMKSWKRAGYVTENQINKYKNMLESSDWSKIKQEHERIMKYMQKPVDMKVFSYVKDKKGKWKGGDKDTTMSPLDSIKYLRMFLQAGSIAVDPHNGHIKAWVGGVDHKYFKLDHVSMGANYVHPKKRKPGETYKKVGRQVGSSIKPFLYGLTIERRGLSPCYEVDDIKLTIEKGYGKFGLIKDWTPSNANGVYSGKRVTLTRALSMSLNSVSAQLMKDFNSSEPFRSFLSEIGIDTSKVPSSPTICLGTPDLTPLEMTGGYTVFASGGVYREPICIVSVVNKNGNVIYSDEDDQITDNVLEKTYAYTMSQMLRGVQSGAPGFNGIKSVHGGKTGTTNFQSDGWYMGITPNLVVGTWVGNDDRFIRFRNLTYGQGGSMARPIFQNMLRYMEADKKLKFDTEVNFPVPEGDISEMNCSKYDEMEGGDSYDFTETEELYREDYEGGSKKSKKPKRKEEEEEDQVIDR